MNPDDLISISGVLQPQVDLGVLNSYSTHTNSVSVDAWHTMHAKLMAQSQERDRQDMVLAQFKQSYIKIRTDNIVLDHQGAIELTKYIFKEADTLTYKDTL